MQGLVTAPAAAADSVGSSGSHVATPAAATDFVGSGGYIAAPATAANFVGSSRRHVATPAAAADFVGSGGASDGGDLQDDEGDEFEHGVKKKREEKNCVERLSDAKFTSHLSLQKDNLP